MRNKADLLLELSRYFYEEYSDNLIIRGKIFESVIKNDAKRLFDVELSDIEIGYIWRTAEMFYIDDTIKI